MHPNIKLLKSLDFFKSFSSAELDQMVQLMRIMKVTEGETLTQKGDTAQTFFIVLSGNYMVQFDNGKALTFHAKGNLMGLSSVITPFQYTGTVIALTNGEVLALPGQEFSKLIQTNTELGSKIMKKISKTLEERMNLLNGK